MTRPREHPTIHNHNNYFLGDLYNGAIVGGNVGGHSNTNHHTIRPPFLPPSSQIPPAQDQTFVPGGTRVANSANGGRITPSSLPVPTRGTHPFLPPSELPQESPRALRPHIVPIVIAVGSAFVFTVAAVTIYTLRSSVPEPVSST